MYNTDNEYSLIQFWIHSIAQRIFNIHDCIAVAFVLHALQYHRRWPAQLRHGG